MAANIQGYNVGTDLSFALTDQFGDVFIDSDLGYLMDFESRADDQMLKVTPITNGGVPIYQTIWNGISGHMSLTRFGPSFQQMIMDLMSGYHGGGVIPQFSLSVDVRNRDGSVDGYLYPGFQFNRPRFGTFRAVREVDMQADFNASQCIGSGSLTAFLAGLAQAA